MLLAAVLIGVIYAWSGLVRGQVPNLRTTPLGARIAGICALGFAFGIFVGGILLSERIRR